MGRTLSEPKTAVRKGRPATAEPERLATTRLELLDSIRTELLAQAPLFEDPFAYGAGVLDTLRAVSAILTKGEQAGRHEGSKR
ncbi:MAG: hypothetical protein KY469_02080 [Actinobacteria bacterium]|nr:hypothetical protein [Actinomycetota bacterium]